MDLIRGDEAPAEIIHFAYGMEHSLGEFYEKARQTVRDRELAELMEKLANVENKHKAYLIELYTAIDSRSASGEILEAEMASKIMEGGFDSAEFLKKNERFMQSVPDLLDLSMMVETQALDLYIRFAGRTENEHTKQVLYKIADEEKGHLAALGELREARA